MPLLFSYGTLQQEDVQLSTFGRLLEGQRDELLGFEPSLVTIEDPKVMAASGRTHHADVTFNGRCDSRVSGTVFEITDAELELVKSHTIVGESLCANLRSLQPVRPIIRSHHERLDGSGYPDGLRGDAIPLLAQIVGVVDVFEALTSERPCQQPLAPEQVALLQTQVEKGWRRADIVNAFAAVVSARSAR